MGDDEHALVCHLDRLLEAKDICGKDGRVVAARTSEGMHMGSTELLADAFDRVRQEVHHVTDGLNTRELTERLDGHANSIGWLVWHLTRVQDDHIADLAGAEQLWTSKRWNERFSLDLPTGSTGYGHTSAEVAAVRVEDPELLTAYHDAVYERTISYVQKLDDTGLDRVVDDSWDPPVTLGVRLISVISEDMQHAGQAAFIRGILKRR